MAQIPVLQEITIEPNAPRSHGKPILELKELEPDWERYDAWRASLIESYSNWLRRRKICRLDDPGI